MKQLRFLRIAGARPESVNLIRTSTSTGGGTGSIRTFSDFVKAAGPSIVAHSQGLAIATVFSGLVAGAVNGHYAENERNPDEQPTNPTS